MEDGDGRHLKIGKGYFSSEVEPSTIEADAEAMDGNSFFSCGFKGSGESVVHFFIGSEGFCLFEYEKKDYSLMLDDFSHMAGSALRGGVKKQGDSIFHESRAFYFEGNAIEGEIDARSSNRHFILDILDVGEFMQEEKEMVGDFGVLSGVDEDPFILVMDGSDIVG